MLYVVYESSIIMLECKSMRKVKNKTKRSLAQCILKKVMLFVFPFWGSGQNVFNGGVRIASVLCSAQWD